MLVVVGKTPNVIFPVGNSHRFPSIVKYLVAVVLIVLSPFTISVEVMLILRALVKLPWTVRKRAEGRDVGQSSVVIILGEVVV